MDTIIKAIEDFISDWPSIKSALTTATANAATNPTGLDSAHHGLLARIMSIGATVAKIALLG